MKFYYAEEVAKKTGISKATLRYYEEEKIIGPINRNFNNYRYYTEDDLEWINVIKLVREIGIPIKELRGATEMSMQERLDGLISYQCNVRQQIQRLKSADKLLENKIKFIKNMNK